MVREAKRANRFAIAVLLTVLLEFGGRSHAQSFNPDYGTENLIVTAPNSTQGDALISGRHTAPWVGTVEAAARRYDLPVEFFVRLLRQESSFFALAVSRKGAQGIAQFMPQTARSRGLRDPFDPFDPDKAIPAAAAYLSELRHQFGNLGLCAAAYNAGATRVSEWLSGRGELPSETQNYVLKITGRSVVEWAHDRLGVSGSIALKVTPVVSRPNGITVVRGGEGKQPAEAQLCGALNDSTKRCIVQNVY